MDFENLPIKEHYNTSKYRELLENKKENIISILNDTEIIEYGISVFNEEKDKFYRRLSNPTAYFSGEPPIIQSKKDIMDELARIDYGIFS